MESVIKSKFSNFELLILDDCSNDGSREYIYELNDKRIDYFKNSNNKGLFFNLSFLIENSPANIIELWAQDDIMYPLCLQHFVEFFNKYPEVGFAYSGIHNVDENGIIKQKDDTEDTPQIIFTTLYARIAFFTGYC